MTSNFEPIGKESGAGSRSILRGVLIIRILSTGAYEGEISRDMMSLVAPLEGELVAVKGRR
jgi:hypothetical protein